MFFLFSSPPLLFRDGCIFSTPISIQSPYFMNILFFFLFSPFSFHVQGFSVPSFLEILFTVYSTSTSQKLTLSTPSYLLTLPFAVTGLPSFTLPYSSTSSLFLPFFLFFFLFLHFTCTIQYAPIIMRPANTRALYG